MTRIAPHPPSRKDRPRDHGAVVAVVGGLIRRRRGRRGDEIGRRWRRVVLSIVVLLLLLVVVVSAFAMTTTAVGWRTTTTTAKAASSDLDRATIERYGPACVPSPPERASGRSSSSSTRADADADDGARARDRRPCPRRDYEAGGRSSRGRRRSNRTPRRMCDTSNPVYFLHVGKSGGTSVDDLLTRIFKCANRTYVGGMHYDWSYVRRRETIRRRGRDHRGYPPPEDDRDRRGPGGRGYEATIASSATASSDADVITFLRHPASRATSQFRFSKSLRWAIESNATFLRQTFDEYLDDEENRTWTQPIADGESGTDFLAGIFPPGGWVGTDGMETFAKSRLRANRTGAILLAAERLEATTWYGLMEDVGRSMELLDASLDLGYVPVLPMTNIGSPSSRRAGRGGGGHPPPSPVLPSEATTERIAKYVPKDMWLYEYARRLFEARYDHFVMGCAYVPPELPPLPDFSR
ncbi:hypothetical protein ACHAW5_002870 [Stephanodiscus triporus]|uniref:Uncharacterized protein n=1 Tax=Stephanodiscus triporus TaxID=2934178 RepID=A0ABD3P9J6_9STRA